MAVVITGLGAFVYTRAGADLLDTVDAGLRSRAELLVTDLQHHDRAPVNVEPTLIENDEVFAQIADAAGLITQSSPQISRWRLLPPRDIRSLHAPGLYDRKVPGIDNVARVLAVPVHTSHGRLVVLVGASLQDRRDALLQLGWTLAIAGSAALALISGGAWLALAGALRPVERMRTQAAAISTPMPTAGCTWPPGKTRSPCWAPPSTRCSTGSRSQWTGNAASWTGRATSSAPLSRCSGWSWTWRSPARKPWTS
jgi:hypothetical protein